MNQIPNIEEIEKILWCVERMLDGTYKTAEHKKLDILNYLKRTLETHHHQLQKARAEERERCIKVVEDYGKSMSKLHSKMIGTAHKDSKMMLAFDMHSRLIAVKHITEKMKHSELDQEVTNEDNLK